MEFLFALVTAICTAFAPAKVVDEIDVPIVMYHHLEEDESKLNEFMVTPEKFESDMGKIKELGYETVSYQELYDFVNHNGNLPEKPILVTFDDGYESNYTYAYPVLKRLNMKATIAVIGVMVGQDTYRGRQAYPHFTYEQAKEMYDSGLMDIQTHTFDLHDITRRVGVKMLAGEDEETYSKLVKEDISKAANEIKENVGNRQFVFTYPYGAYDDLTENIIRDLGFDITVTTDVGTNHIVRGDTESLLRLKRYDISNESDIEIVLTGRYKTIVNLRLLLTNSLILI